MGGQPRRRDVLKTGGLVVGGALLAGLPAQVAYAAPTFTVKTVAMAKAARTDRRPVAGGVYDATANKTFITWGGQAEDTYVQSLDHATGVWSAPVKVMSGGGDSHNYPTIVQAADGRLLIFVGMHNAQLVVARSATPRSISGTWSVKSVAQGPAASYPMPFKAANNNIFCFFRETTGELDASVPTDTRPMKYVRSTDNGVTWKNSVQLTSQSYAMGSTDRSDHLNEVYIGQLRREAAGGGRPERVHIVWTIAGGGPDQHKHDFYHKNIYYATFDPATLKFRTVAGADLGQQMSRTDMDKCRVELTPLTLPGGEQSPDYIHQVGYLGDGRPFVVWGTFDDSLLAHTMVAVWSGSAWQTREVATGLRIRDIERLSSNSWRVYANRETAHDVIAPNIETYLLDSGTTWTAETTIAVPKAVQRIEVIAGAKDPARILATGASSARDVSIADGDVYVAGL
jgi:hypothetical protein